VFTYERVAKIELKTKLYNVAITKYFGNFHAPLLLSFINVKLIYVGNNEACLVAFDIHGGIHMFTLLDLTRVHSMSYPSHVRYFKNEDFYGYLLVICN
jgi:hypothetical protein